LYSVCSYRSTTKEETLRNRPTTCTAHPRKNHTERHRVKAKEINKGNDSERERDKGFRAKTLFSFRTLFSLCVLFALSSRMLRKCAHGDCC
jgi:hypothetical protein